MKKIYVLQEIAPKVAESSYIYRQIFATIAASLLAISGGITFGFTAVLLPQLEADSSFNYDKSYDSWIASISPLAMLPGCLFSGMMSDAIGRRMGQIVLIGPFIIGWLIIAFATNSTAMLIGRFITGLATGAVRPNSMVFLSEVTAPKYRGMALFSPSLALQIGALISHTVGKYVYWKISCFIYMLPSVLSLLILLFLKESPLWLLSKGKVDEGIKSFKEFRGNGESAENELKSVLESSKTGPTEESSFKYFLNTVFSRQFMRSMASIVFLFIGVQWCGVNTLSFYAEFIFEATFSGDVDAFMLMVSTDCIRILAAVLICSVAKFIPRRSTFIGCCYSTTLVLICLVIYLYLSPVGYAGLAVTLMVLYIAIASILTCVSWSFVGEIFPAKVRGFGSGLSSGISFGLLFVSVRVTPEIIAKCGKEIMYAQFAVVTLITGIVLCFILPETNGKSLQAIEDDLYIKKVDVNKSMDVVNEPSNPPPV